MTDITELAQREKFEAWARSQQLSIAYGDCGYVYSSTEMAWRAVKALSAELVEALEKAQQRIASQREYYEGVIADGGKRIAELESRTITVKLPPAVSVADWMVDIDVYEADLLRALLTAAGIKVEAE
jgi:predicted flavoprotein YhiN